jgi:uncharacterized protein (TIGR03086 family)
MTDFVDAHRRALGTSAAIVGSVQLTDLDRPTPCAGWDLRQLLAHMIGQNYGFAEAAEGNGGDLAVFADRAVGADPVGEYAASAARAIQAFGAAGVLERDVEVAVVRGGVTLPGSAVIGFHLVDYVVHGWDVAKTVGVPAAYDDDVLRIALEVAEAVPERARSEEEATPFRPTVPTESRQLLDRIVANLGRSPDWTPDAGATT